MSKIAKSSTSPTPPPPGFKQGFAWLVLIVLAVVLFICDALPAIVDQLFPAAEVAAGPIASLLSLMSSFFWPGTMLVHSGLATLWLACGAWRYSLRMLIVILSMSARALWVWMLYGINEPHPTDHGEPFIVSGVPVLFFIIISATSLNFVFERFRTDKGAPQGPHKLQILDMIIWTAAIALLLGPAVSFFKVLTSSILEERLKYDTTLILAWAALTWFSAMLLREWFHEARFVARLSRLAWLGAALAVTCILLIFAAKILADRRLIAEIAAVDMAENVLTYLLPSTIGWCMAVGWAMRELGVRLEKRPSPALPQ